MSKAEEIQAKRERLTLWEESKVYLQVLKRSLSAMERRESRLGKREERIRFKKGKSGRLTGFYNFLKLKENSDTIH